MSGDVIVCSLHDGVDDLKVCGYNSHGVKIAVRFLFSLGSDIGIAFCMY